MLFIFDWFLTNRFLTNSHKKRKDNLETSVALLTFSLELEISGVAVQKTYRNSKKLWLCEELLSEIYFEAVLTTFVAMTMVPTLLRQFRKSLQIKRLSQMLFVCYSLLKNQNISVNNSEKRFVTY